MSLRVCEETGDRSGYDRDDFGSAYSSKEDEIVASLPQIDGQVYTPYICTLLISSQTEPPRRISSTSSRWQRRTTQDSRRQSTARSPATSTT